MHEDTMNFMKAVAVLLAGMAVGALIYAADHAAYSATQPRRDNRAEMERAAAEGFGGEDPYAVEAGLLLKSPLVDRADYRTVLPGDTTRTEIYRFRVPGKYDPIYEEYAVVYRVGPEDEGMAALLALLGE